MVGCGHTPMKPLSPYNDIWRGELRLGPSRVLPVAMTVAVTRKDERLEREAPHDKRALAELYVEETGPLAATGTISHYNFAEHRKALHDPHPDREFVELELRGAGGIGGAEADPCAARRHRAALHELLLRVRPAGLGDWDGTLSFLGERVYGDVIQGIVLLKLSRTGACTRRRRGRCDMWSVEARKEEVGRFVLERTGAAREVRHVGQCEVQTRSFVLRREEPQPGTVGWTLGLAPGRPGTGPRMDRCAD